MSPEEYRRTVSEGFGAAAGWITFLLAVVAAIVCLGAVFWLMFVRGLPLGELMNRLLAALPSAPWEGLLSVARAFLGLSAVHLLAAASLAYGSIPVAVIMPLLGRGPGKEDRVDLRRWMLHPDRARELVHRFAGRDVCLERP